MIDEGIRCGTTSPPTRELIAKWAAYVKDQFKETHIRNAWRHEPYSWFPTCDRIPSTTPGVEPPRDARDSGSARSHSTHLETSFSDRP